MTEHRLEVADVFHAHQNQFLQRWGHVVSDQQRKVLRDICRCRTAALGTHLERCDRCDYETVAYDSCRNRHCPKCQSSARDRWLMKQASSLLPVPYAHVVFKLVHRKGRDRIARRCEDGEDAELGKGFCRIVWSLPRAESTSGLETVLP